MQCENALAEGDTTPKPNQRPASFLFWDQSTRPRRMVNRNSSLMKGSNIPGLNPPDAVLDQSSPRQMPQTKVRNLGRKILARENKSSWFDNMITELETPADEVSGEIAEREKIDVVTKDAGSDQLKPLEIDEEEKPKQEMEKEVDEVEEMEKQEKLQEQIVQQHELAQLSVEKKEDVSEPQAQDTETSQTIPSTPPVFKKWTFRRRLKGDVARNCAVRDEGCLKNLIWYQDENGKKLASLLDEKKEECLVEPKENELVKSKEISRNANNSKADVGDTMANLLSNYPTTAM